MRKVIGALAVLSVATTGVFATQSSAAVTTPNWVNGPTVDGGDGHTLSTSTSADGRFVVFVTDGRYSAADVDTQRDVYLHDRVTGETTMISRPSQAMNSDGRISPSGRFIAFGERDESRTEDEVVHLNVFDRATGLYHVSGKDNGVGNPFGGIVDVADTGTLLIDNGFSVLGEGPPLSQVFVVDLNGTIDNLSPVIIDGKRLVPGTNNISLSGDGTTVVVALDQWKIAAYDRATGLYDVVSDPTGASVFSQALVSWNAVSYTGRYVAFLSRATNLVPGMGGPDTPYLFDRLTRTITVIGPSDSAVGPGSVSADGRYVGFENSSGSLDPTNLGVAVIGRFFLYVRDTVNGTTTRVSDAVARQELNQFRFASAVGAFSFTTLADLAPGDANAGQVDIDTYFTEPLYSSDTTPPVVTAFVTPPPNTAGWHNAPVTVAWGVVDPAPSSGPPTQPPLTQIISEGAAISVTSEASCDPAGNCSTGSAIINLDMTPPAIVATTQPLPNSAGWINQPVHVHWSCTDDHSGIASCPPDSDFTSSTAGTMLSATATDKAGNTAQSATSNLRVDLEAPSIQFVGLQSAGEYTVGNAPTPTCVATDALSGVSAPCAGTMTGPASGVGAFTYNATARDVAGNIASASIAWHVSYGFSGFLQPINDTGHQVDLDVSVFQAGSTVPVKFQLLNSNGVALVNIPTPLWVAPVEGGPMSSPANEVVYVEPGDTGVLFDLHGSIYSYNWKTTKAMAGSWWQIGVRLADGTVRTVTIGLR